MVTVNRGKKSTYSCAWCHIAFTARVADRERGWARFCSKSCKAKSQTAARAGAEWDPRDDLPISHDCTDGGGWEVCDYGRTEIEVP